LVAAGQSSPLETLRSRLSVKRLFFDIETSPNIGTFWRPQRKTYLTYENISEERRIICAAWKWENSKAVHHVADWDDDREIVARLIAVLDQADEIVAHNGDKFDMRWVRGRALHHGLYMSHSFTLIDTLKHARKLFDLNSYRLVYLAKYLNVGTNKIEMTYQDWLDAMAGDERVRKRMIRYNRRDVRVLEAVFEKLCPYLKITKPVVDDLARCGECGSEELTEAKRWLTAAGYGRVEVRCGDCGKARQIATSRWDKA